MWYKKANPPDFIHIDPKENWEEAEEAEQVFKQNDIRPDSTKTIHQVAVENGIVIGAIASSWNIDGSYGFVDDNGQEDLVYVFSFDLVVKPEFRRQGVGLKLIQDAIKKYNDEKRDYQEMGHKTMMRIWVVNPILVPVLERLGFTIESTYEYDGKSFGSAHLVAY